MAGHHQDGCGVQQNHVARRSAFAGEDGPEDACVALRIGAAQCVHRMAGKVGIFRRKIAAGYLAIAHLGKSGAAADGELVDAAVGMLGAELAVNDQGAVRAEQHHRLGDERHLPRTKDAHHLARGSCRVRQRTEKIEDGAHAKRATHPHDGAHGGMVRGRVEKGEAVPAKGVGRLPGGEVDGNAEGFEYVCGAAA